MKNLFAWFFVFLMPLFIIDDDGSAGGAGDDSDNSGDDNQNPPPATDTNPKADNADPAATVTISKSELDALTGMVNDYTTQKVINEAHEDIKTRVPDFDLKAVHAHLKEMNKTNPTRAQALNNPAGWELLYTSEVRAAKVEADKVNHGRKVGDDSRAELLEKVKNGQGSHADEAKLLEKYM